MYTTSEQHKDNTKTCQETDMNDTWKDTYKRNFIPTTKKSFYNLNKSLHSISTGTVADSTIDVDSVKSIGNNLLQSMVG